MIPKNPGCYLFKDRRGNIIYVGKAKNLNKRVNSYFSKKHTDPKTQMLVKSISSTDFFITDTEVEALVLENNLIKKYQPKYNINLKDSKRYAYLKLTDDEIPRLVLARKREKTGKYYGPFVSAAERDYVKDVVIKTFKIRTCKRLPKKPCLRYHIGICSAPCIDTRGYDSQIKSAQMVLRGHSEKVSAILETQMLKASKQQRFERAMEVRDQMKALEYLRKRQNMERQKKYNEDIVNYLEREGEVFLALFNIHHGTLYNKKEFTFSKTPDWFEEFLLQYYSENEIPREIVVPKKIDLSIEEFLKKRVKIPLRGEKKQLLALVKKNIEITHFGQEEKLEALKKALRLPEKPNVIECFDISHLSGSSTVGSMVQFRNARPDKNNYRRFKIRTVEGIDDFKSIAEVVRRRYSRLQKESSAMPDLIVIDGGKGQLSNAVGELKKLGLRLPIISIAKREEEIFVPGLKFAIPFGKVELNLIREIRDEAHRFAIKYNRLLRKKKMIGKKL